MKYQKELNLSVGLCRHSLATNGSAAWRRSGLERRNFQLCTNVAKPFFLFAKLQKRAKEKWFLRINM